MDAGTMTRTCFSISEMGLKKGDWITFGDSPGQWIVEDVNGHTITCRPATWREGIRWGRVALAVAAIVAAVALLFACITSPAPEDKPAARTAPADTCKPPTCYPDLRPPGSPR